MPLIYDPIHPEYFVQCQAELPDLYLFDVAEKTLISLCEIFFTVVFPLSVPQLFDSLQIFVDFVWFF